MAIDFNKVQKDVASRSETIPISNLKPKTPSETATDTSDQQKGSSGPGRPNKGLDRNYTRVGFDNDVWQAMKYKKCMSDESFTDQVNNALRLYLGIKTK